MKTVNDEQLLFLLELHISFGASERRIEPLLKVLHRIEDARQQEIQQRPQFCALNRDEINHTTIQTRRRDLADCCAMACRSESVVDTSESQF